MNFSELLTRADEELLQRLVGRPAVRLLALLDPALAAPSQLRGLVTGLWQPEELLRNPSIRNDLLDLLSPADARKLATALDPTGVSDAYSALRAASFRKNSGQERILFRILGVVPPETVPFEEALEALQIVPAYQLFSHQRAAARQARNYLANESRRVLLHLPTGSGKTRTAMYLICDHLRRVEPTLVVWLAYSEELCEQAAVEFEQAWKALGDRPLDVYRFWGRRQLKPNTLRDGLIVAGLGKVYETTRRDIEFIATLADRTSLVIIDEAHQAVARTYRLILDILVEKNPSTALLGLTATPGLTWADIDADQQLADFFNRNKVTLEVPGFENPMDYLITAGYLARPTFDSLLHVPGRSLSPADVRELSDALDIPQRLLAELAQDEQRNLSIVQRVEELVGQHSRILVFAATVNHARLLATVLRARGIDADAVTAATPALERTRLITKFRSKLDKPLVLCNYGVLTSGFDAPRTSAAVIARPTKSLVLYSQMVGRAIRGPRAGGNKEAVVVTVVDTTLPGFGSMSEAFQNWEDVWHK